MHESVICEKLDGEKSYYLLHYVCQACINSNGSHIYIPPGQGKTMLDVAASSEGLKRNLLTKLTDSLT
ncbi:22795_t:CDS:2, partial [Gigaspora rosea]